MKSKIKALLSAEEYSDILKLFKKNLKALKKVIKDDAYYSQINNKESTPSEKPFIKVRVEQSSEDANKKTSLVLKDRKIIDDHELFYERSTEISDFEVIDDLLFSLNCDVYLKKHIDAWQVKRQVKIDNQSINVTCELEIVNYQLFYLEISCTDIIIPSLVKDAIDAAFKELGISSSHYDLRDWQQILNF